jgi:hypothetical protein
MAKITRPLMKFEREYSQVPHAWSRDKRLSFRARGLLIFLFSHTAGWSTSVVLLAKMAPEGKDAISSALRELERFGYLTRVQHRDDKGRMSDVEYVLCDPFEGVHTAVDDDNVHTPDDDDVHTPEPAENQGSEAGRAHDAHVHREPLTGFPSTAYPSPGEPSPANPPYKKIKEEEENQKEEDLVHASVHTPPALFPVVDVEDQFAELWAAWPVKKNRVRALERWRKLSPPVRARVLPLALEHAHAFAGNTPKDFTPHLDGWLHSQRWDDELAEPEHRRQSRYESPDEKVRRIMTMPLPPAAPRSGQRPPDQLALDS